MASVNLPVLLFEGSLSQRPVVAHLKHSSEANSFLFSVQFLACVTEVGKYEEKGKSLQLFSS